MANISINIHVYDDEIKAHEIPTQATGELARYVNIGEATIFYNDIEKVKETIKELKKLEKSFKLEDSRNGQKIVP